MSTDPAMKEAESSAYELQLIAVPGLPEFVPGMDLPRILADHAPLCDRDILVVTQKVISKAEGRLVEVDANDPLSHKAIVEEESVRVLRRRGELIISETKHGFVCANAGIDLSNVERGQAALLPIDSDRSARRIQDVVRHLLDINIGVIISDTFGRPWRRGVTDVAIGSAGVKPILDLRGTQDAYGRELQVTEVALIDELASAAELVMGKSTGIAAAIVRGGPASWFGSGSVRTDIVRSPQDDLFR